LTPSPPWWTPQVESDFTYHLSEKTARFRRLQEHRNPLHWYDLVIEETGVSLYVKTQHPVSAHPPLPQPNTGGGPMRTRPCLLPRSQQDAVVPVDSGELIGQGVYSEHTKVALHPASITHMAVQLPRLGASDPRDVVMRTLVCETRQARDVVAMLWRTFRSLALNGQIVEDDTPQLETLLSARSASMDMSGERRSDPCTTFPPLSATLDS
jgi:hypothetical protein